VGKKETQREEERTEKGIKRRKNKSSLNVYCS
jgi:hypothetical protein